MSYYYDDPWYKGWIPWVIIALAAILLIGLYLAVKEDQKFNKFVAEHNCKAIAQDPGYYMTTFMPMSCGNGCTSMIPIMTWVNGAKTWRCEGLRDFKR